MKVRVTVSFNHDVQDSTEASRLIDLLKDDGRVAAAIHTYGGDAINFEWERRRDRKAKAEAPVADAAPTNVVPLAAAS
jgi:hypothetical protein